MLEDNYYNDRNDMESDFDPFDPFTDPLDFMTPDDLTFQDYANVLTALAFINEAYKLHENESTDFGIGFNRPEGFSDTVRRVKSLMQVAGKDDPESMINFLVESLKNSTVPPHE